MTDKQLVGIRLPADMLAAIRADADAKGQPLNVWFTRAAAAALGGDVIGNVVIAKGKAPIAKGRGKA